MKLHFPRTKPGEQDKILEGLLRQIERVGDKWSVKVTVPSLSLVQNFYLELDDDEMKEFKKYATAASVPKHRRHLHLENSKSQTYCTTQFMPV